MGAAERLPQRHDVTPEKSEEEIQKIVAELMKEYHEDIHNSMASALNSNETSPPIRRLQLLHQRLKVDKTIDGLYGFEAVRKFYEEHMERGEPIVLTKKDIGNAAVHLTREQAETLGCLAFKYVGLDEDMLLDPESIPPGTQFIIFPEELRD